MAVKRATQAMLIEQHVEAEVSKTKQGLSDTVLAAAEVNRGVILRHRSDIARARRLAMMLLTELDEATRSPEQLRELVARAAEGTHPSAATALQEAARDAVKLSQRVGSLHRLTDTLTKLQGLERKAFSLDDKDDKTPNAYEDGLRQLAGGLH